MDNIEEIRELLIKNGIEMNDDEIQRQSQNCSILSTYGSTMLSNKYLKEKH